MVIHGVYRVRPRRGWRGVSGAIHIDTHWWYDGGVYKRINITLAEEVLGRADEFAARERYTRSGLIAAALEAFVSAEAAPAAEEDGLARGGASVAAEAPAAFGALATPTEVVTLERTTERLRAFFSARDDVEAAWVFGSVARGNAGPMSDVDVAILPAAAVAREAWWDLRLDLMSRLPGVLGVHEVDVVAVPEASVVLGFEIASEGVQVFGEWSRVAAEAVIAAVTEYWDYADVRARAREALGERMRAYAAGE